MTIKKPRKYVDNPEAEAQIQQNIKSYDYDLKKLEQRLLNI